MNRLTSNMHIMIFGKTWAKLAATSQSSYELTWHIVPISYPAYNPAEG